MSNRKNITYLVKIALVIIILVLFVVARKDWIQDLFRESEDKAFSEKSIYPEIKPYHAIEFEDRELFLKSVADYPIGGESMDSNIKGGIVPHHLLPSFIIADFFSRLSVEEVETIILVGPNHYERGDANVITSKYNWENPFGTLKPNIDIINDLEKKQLLKINEEVLPLDHSMTSILPFIQYYLPEAKVVPLILSNEIKEGEITVLAKELQGYIQNKKIIILASVDFSHYLTNFEAKEKNIESLRAIEKRSYDELFSFGNDHMDSPASVALVLKTMDAINANKMTVLHDTNSGEMLGDNFSQITSYLSLSFSAKK
jgi:AmmeMemoRadiSam system protein B